MPGLRGRKASDTVGMALQRVDLSTVSVALLSTLDDAKLEALASAFAHEEHWLGGNPITVIRRMQLDNRLGAALHVTAWSGNRPVALFGWRPFAGNSEHLETETYVCRDWRGTGLAGALKSLQWDVAKATGRRLFVAVNVRNTRAIRYVTKLWPWIFTQTVFLRGAKNVVWDVTDETPEGYAPSLETVTESLAPLVEKLAPASHRQRPAVALF